MLNILVLGPPNIRDEDQPIRIQRRLVRNMLLYLACQPEMVSRASLLFLFWENLNERDARRRLRETLSKLRSQLPDPSVLITEQDQVGLDRQKVYIDLDEFRNIYKYSVHAGHQFSLEGPLPAGIAQTMERAIHLWRGPQFLSGVEFYESIDLEQWVTNTQADLAQKRRVLLLRMADHHIASANLEQALEYLHSLLLDNDLDTEVNYRFLTCLVELGRISEALYRLRELEKLFNKELSMDLPPVFKGLQDEIKEFLSIKEIPSVSKWNIPISTSIPLFGRSDQLEELKRCFQKGGVVLLSGEPGAGKTRVVYELYQSILPAPILLAASASSLGQNLPFSPVIEILRVNLSPKKDTLDPNTKHQLSKLLPYTLWEDNPSANAVNLESPEERHLLFEAIRRFLLDICKGRNVLFFLDNSQWLDQSSMEVLEYLYQQDFFQPNRLLVMARRYEKRIIPLNTWRKGIEESSPMSFITLGNLDLNSTADMARYILGTSPPDQTIKQLYSQTGGNPFFLIETLRIMLQAYPSIKTDQGIYPAHLPNSINMLVQDRLATLPRDTKKILETASVIRNDFTPQQLEGITGFSPEDIVQALEDLESSSLIQVSNTQSAGGAYNFIHDIVRERVYSGLSLARRRLLHQTVAFNLQADPIPVHPAILAFHFEAAGEILKAVGFWIQAGEAAAKLLSQGSAYQAFQQAEKLLQQINFQMEPGSIYRLYSSWGELAYNINDIAAMKLIYQKLLTIGREKEDALLIGTALSGQAAAYSVTDDYQEANNIFLEAIRYLNMAQNTYEIIRAYNKKGFLETTFCHFKEAGITLGNALELGRGSKDKRIQRALITTGSYLSLVESSEGWQAKGIEYAEKARLESKKIGYLFGELRAVTLLAISYYNSGEFHKSLEYCRHGLEQIESPVLWRIESQLRTVAVSNEVSLGHLDQCLEHLNINLKFCSQPGTALIKTNYHSAYGDIYRHLHAFPEAVREYRKALEGIQVSHMSIQVLHRLSFALFSMDQLTEAEKVIQQVIDLSKLGDALQIYLQADLTRALVYAELGRLDEAFAVNQSVSEEFNKRELRYQQVSADWVQGYLELKSNHYENARHFAQKTIRQARDLSMIWLEIRGHELLRNLPDSSNNETYVYIQRIYELLEIIGKQTRSAELQPFFTRYKEAMLNKFER